MTTIKIPELLLPKKELDLNKWAVIACDQFTSQKEYWETLDAYCGDKSTLRLIFPEYYLNGADDKTIDAGISAIHSKMEEYLSNDVFDTVNDFVLVERTLPTGGTRIGLVVSIDLDAYDYHLGNTAAIRATEATVEQRLPVRIRIREGAKLELSHALALVDDEKDGIIEQLYKKRAELPLLYDFEANMDGGHIRGYRVTDSEKVLEKLEKLTEKRSMKYAVGDGNHSIASAKAYWDRVKSTLSESERADHPARYCTCELINLNSDGLTFHPIHRVIYNVDFDEFFAEIKGAIGGTGKLELIYNDNRYCVPADQNATTTYEKMATFIADYLASHPNAAVDYIHGEQHLQKVARSLNGIGILMPTIKKSELFPYVEQKGILPKKAFSLGEAEEKRYYMECKIIK